RARRCAFRGGCAGGFAAAHAAARGVARGGRTGIGGAGARAGGGVAGSAPGGIPGRDAGRAGGGGRGGDRAARGRAHLARLCELLLEIRQLPVLEFEQPLQVADVLLQLVDPRLRLAQRVVARHGGLGGIGRRRAGGRAGNAGTGAAGRELELIAGGGLRRLRPGLADGAGGLLPTLLAADLARIAREAIAVLVECLQARAHLRGDFRLGERAHLGFGGDRQAHARAHLVHAAEEGVGVGAIDRDDRLVERHAGRAVLLGDFRQRVAAAHLDGRGPRSGGRGRGSGPQDRGRRRGRRGRLGGRRGALPGRSARLGGGQGCRRRSGRGRRSRGGDARGDRRGGARAAVHGIGAADLHP